ncbi:Putative ribonuclease H protein At1g65750 [Linum perenne]
MTKIAFLFLQKSDDLWVRVLQSKYFREVDGNLRPRQSKSQSALWRGVLRAWGFMLDGARAGIGNGEETLFWTGKWLDSGNKLIDLVSNVNEPIDLEAPVINFIDADGEWDILRRRHHLDEDAIQEIVGMLPPSAERGADSWNWGCESNGKFSIRSAYDIITKPVNHKPEMVWDLVWKWSGPSRVQHFLWLVAHEKLLTNLERKRLHIAAEASCRRCAGRDESNLHVLRDCDFASRV